MIFKKITHFCKKKHIKYKKIASIFFFATIFFQAHAFKFDMFLEPFATVRFGSVYEYVFENTRSATNYTLSELQWQLQPVWILGSNLGFSFGIIDLSASFGFGLPLVAGKLIDYDYLNYDGNITHFSEHTAKIKHYVDFSLEVSARFPVLKSLILKPILGFAVLSSAWDGTDGYAQYPAEISKPYTPWDPNLFPKENEQYLSGKIISYEQIILYPFVGLSLDFVATRFFTVGMNFTFAPYVWGIGLDDHWIKRSNGGIHYRDELKDGFMFGAGLEMQIIPRKKQAIILSMDMKLIDKLKGDSFSQYLDADGKPDGTFFKQLSTGGGKQTYFSFTLMYRISFF